MHSLESTLIWLLSMATLVNTIPVPEDGVTVHVELVKTLNDHDTKRDADKSLMPDALVVRFPLHEENVILRLQRVPSPPVYLVGEQGTTKVTDLENRKSSVYVDPSRSATFVVRKEDNGHFTLDGSLKQHRRTFSMKPAVDRTRFSVHRNNHHLIATPLSTFRMTHKVELSPPIKLATLPPIEMVTRPPIEMVTRPPIEKVTLPPIVLDEFELVTAPPKPLVQNDVRLIRPNVQVDNLEDDESTRQWGQRGEAENKEQQAERQNRQTSVDRHVVETTFVIDDSDFEAWKARYPTSSHMPEMLQYYTYIGQMLNNIFTSVNSADSSLDIKVAVTGIVMLGSSARRLIEPNGGYVNATAYLDALAAWIPANLHPDLANNDHFMAFTAHTPYWKGPAFGVAYNEKVCTSKSVSVVKDTFHASVSIVAAQELAHSLGADNDGDDTGNAAGCSQSSMHVMAPQHGYPPPTPVSGRNLFSFSRCSVAAFKRYLKHESCTRPTTTFTDLALLFNSYDNPLITYPSKQCQLAFGDGSDYLKPHLIGMDEEDICVGMPCSINATSGAYILPFDGTPCSHGKVCFQGVCVKAGTFRPASQIF